MADTDKEKNQAKLMEILDQLALRMGALMAGKFTGSVKYELHLTEGGFQSDYIATKGRMTPRNSKKKVEEG